MANSVDPDETARYEPSHLDLRCLQRYLYWSVGMNGLSGYDLYNIAITFLLFCSHLEVVTLRKYVLMNSKFPITSQKSYEFER